MFRNHFQGCHFPAAFQPGETHYHGQQSKTELKTPETRQATTLFNNRRFKNNNNKNIQGQLYANSKNNMFSKLPGREDIFLS